MFYPELELVTDNGAMIAFAGAMRFGRQHGWRPAAGGLRYGRAGVCRASGRPCQWSGKRLSFDCGWAGVSCRLFCCRCGFSWVGDRRLMLSLWRHTSSADITAMARSSCRARVNASGAGAGEGCAEGC